MLIIFFHNATLCYAVLMFSKNAHYYYERGLIYIGKIHRETIPEVGYNASQFSKNDELFYQNFLAVIVSISLIILKVH